MSPIEVVIDDAGATLGAVRLASCVLFAFSPLLIAQGASIGVDQYLRTVEAQSPVFLHGGAVDSPSVLDAGVETADQYVPDISGAVVTRVEWKLREWLVVIGEKDHE